MFQFSVRTSYFTLNVCLERDIRFEDLKLEAFDTNAKTTKMLVK